MRHTLLTLIALSSTLGALPATLAAQTGADADLLRAIGANDVAAAKRALDAGARADASGENPPLVAAVRFGRPAIVRLLLERGANANAPVVDPAGGNAVSVAFTAMNGMALLGRLDEPDPTRRGAALEVLRALTERKPDLDRAFRVGPTNATPLMLAAQAGALDVVRILLDAGANPNAPNGGRYTAIDYAADRAPGWSTFPPSDRVEIVRLLLAKGARVDRAGADGVRPAARAHRAGNAEIASLIESRS